MLRTVILVISACLIYGIMQGVYDNYGIMMKALVPETGISYQLSGYQFCDRSGSVPLWTGSASLRYGRFAEI